jgi:hypothetical protein
MKMINNTILSALVLIVIISFSVNAQIEPELFIDYGKHNASNGMIVNSGLCSSYSFGSNELKAGALFDIKPHTERVFKGGFAEITHDFKIKEINLKADAFFMYSNFSDLLFEYNWGIALGLNHNHFKFKLGTFSKNYSLTSYAITEFEFNDNYTFRESFGIQYYVGYQIKTNENDFNILAAITNRDFFLITQTTNPMLKVRSSSRLSEDLMWFAEVWLKTSGSFNLSINYFGFLARTGLKWKIG